MDSTPPINLTININQPHLEGTDIMAEIDRLAAAIAAEVAEAITSAQSRIDDALAAAAASDEQRQIVQAELDSIKARAAALAENVEAEGLYGQDGEEPETPGEGEPTEPVPGDDETGGPGEDSGDNEPPTNPGGVVF